MPDFFTKTTTRKGIEGSNFQLLQAKKFSELGMNVANILNCIVKMLFKIFLYLTEGFHFGKKYEVYVSECVYIIHCVY